ncbi:hypothetical protein Ddye_028504 [Dipteronia dyeriana]|uniref:Uncharacterized protein n=1 Tax=Dipteronia dyeriana TaxID=168575 RepID=A0AAD9TCT7_9ROSI|nr:hypothetical protein Ddye_028504 [Dipteronia dyeriana]
MIYMRLERWVIKNNRVLICGTIVCVDDYTVALWALTSLVALDGIIGIAKDILLSCTAFVFNHVLKHAAFVFTHLTFLLSVTDLDLSLLSVWATTLSSPPPRLPIHCSSLTACDTPLVASLTVYSRSPSTLEVLLPQWPRLSHVKLVRSHQRPQLLVGADFVPLFEQCESLTSLDLPNFYYRTEDLPPALQAYLKISA